MRSWRWGMGPFIQMLKNTQHVELKYGIAKTTHHVVAVWGILWAYYFTFCLWWNWKTNKHGVIFRCLWKGMNGKEWTSSAWEISQNEPPDKNPLVMSRCKPHLQEVGHKVTTMYFQPILTPFHRFPLWAYIYLQYIVVSYHRYADLHV